MKKNFASKTVGDIQLECSDEIQEWRFSVESLMSSDHVEILHFSMENDCESYPPEVMLSFSVPMHDIQNCWNTISEHGRLPPDWGGTMRTGIANGIPLVALINNRDRNRLTIGCSESSRTISITAGVREESADVVFRIGFFSGPESMFRSYSAEIRIDKRDIFYADAIRDSAEWIGLSQSTPPCVSPLAAFEPVYSSWYSFHQNLLDSKVESECKIAAAIGMKTVIVDDGWQTEDSNRGYAWCGDWTVSAKRFPNMAGHVAKILAMGMKYILWYSVPFIGVKSENYERFRGKYLINDCGMGAGILDPRFPDVRDFLIKKYANAVKDWNISGLKLDFIDRFTIPCQDPGKANGYAGRDYKSIPDAVDRLLADVSSALRAIKPDILIEFRQPYIGPGIRKFGNMLRAGDCPGDIFTNRIRTVNLRLTSGTTAVHSDMLMWNQDELPEIAALQIISVLFSVIQYSMMLSELSDAHREMLCNWLAFTATHKDTLLHSSLSPHHPESGYTVVSAESKTERIIAVYDNQSICEIGSPNKNIVIVNGTGSDRIYLSLLTQIEGKLIDCRGRFFGRISMIAGISEIKMPISGRMEISI